MLSSYTLSKRTEMVVGFHSCFFVPVVPRFFCRSNVVSSDSFKLICELRSAELNRFFFLVFFFIGVLIKVLSFSLPFGILVLFSQISSSSSLFIAVIASQSSPLLKRTWLFILFSIYAGSVIAFGVPSVIVGIFDTFPKPKKKGKDHGWTMESNANQLTKHGGGSRNTSNDTARFFFFSRHVVEVFAKASSSKAQKRTFFVFFNETWSKQEFYWVLLGFT